ncbi:hypothetical protein M0R72_06185 [Candidatus Pacearchaeota archaeon]|jgi:hypothetical protein|nr:hypothetical protein [Candidatus Pacearchaeota archaeon]
MVHGIDRPSITFQATGKRAGVLTVRHPRGSPKSVKVELEKVNISGQARQSVQFTGGKAVPITTVPTTKNEWVYSGEYSDDVIDSFERADALRRLNRVTGAGAVRGGGFVKAGEKAPTNTMGEAIRGKTYHMIGDEEEDDEEYWMPLAARRAAAKAKYAERAKKHNVKGKDSPQQDLDTIAMVAEIRGKSKKARATAPPRSAPRSDQDKFRRMDELQLLLAKRLRQITILGHYTGKASDRDKTVKALEKKIAALSKGKDRIRRRFSKEEKTPIAIVKKKATPKRLVAPKPAPKNPAPKKSTVKKRSPPKASNFAQVLTAYVKKIGVSATVAVHKYPKGASAQYSYEVSMKKRDKAIEARIDKFYDANKKVPRDGVLRFKVGGLGGA